MDGLPTRYVYDRERGLELYVTGADGIEKRLGPIARAEIAISPDGTATHRCEAVVYPRVEADEARVRVREVVREELAAHEAGAEGRVRGAITRVWEELSGETGQALPISSEARDPGACERAPSASSPRASPASPAASA